MWTPWNQRRVSPHDPAVGPAPPKRLKPRGGIVLGRHKGEYLVDQGVEHVAVIGPTRCGKGINNMNTTLKNGWYDSAFIIDPKGDLWEETAWARGKWSHLLKFDPTDRDSVRFNPLDDVRPGDGCVAGIQNKMLIACDYDPVRDAKDHFRTAAFQVNVATALHLLHWGPRSKRNFGEIRRFVQRGDAAFREIIERGSHPVAVRIAEMLFSGSGKKPKEKEAESSLYRGSVYNTAATMLMLWDDEIVDWLTAETEFPLSALMCWPKNPSSLYFIVRASDQDRLAPLVSMMATEFQRSLMYAERTSRYGEQKFWPVMICADEIGDLKWPGLAKALRSMASFGIRLLAAGQSKFIIDTVHTRELLQNCTTKIRFAPEDKEDLRELQDLIGMHEVEDQSESESYAGIATRTRSITRRMVDKPKLRMSDIPRWRDQQKCLLTGHGDPTLIDIVQSYKEKDWVKLSGPAPRCRDDNGAYRFLPGKFTSPWDGFTEDKWKPVKGEVGKETVKPERKDGELPLEMPDTTNVVSL